MRGAWKAHGDDPDVGALFAEAMMDLRPWDQWTPGGQPQPGTEEILATLEPSLEPKKLGHQAAQALRTALGLIVAVRSGRAFRKPNTLVKLV